MTAFRLGRLPRILFGSGCLQQLVTELTPFGNNILLVTGAQSWQQASWWEPLQQSLQQASIQFWHCQIQNEPEAAQIDALVAQYRGLGIQAVVAIGGGSALDAGKAIAGLLAIPNSVMDFLEGVGPELPYTGPAVPFIAVPTTAGTGSEATRNAVLSQHGIGGFKKSFRDEALIPELALVDPDLLASCPAAVIAANGMDAITQLIESYVSLRADRLQRSLCRDALHQAALALPKLIANPASKANANARADMAYAALISGINLAHTGLGSVHGLAAPLGAFYPIPHGVACGTLLAEATDINLRALEQRQPQDPALRAYAEVGEIICRSRFESIYLAHKGLIKKLREWQDKFALPKLGNYGVEAAHIDNIVANARGSSMQTNPIVLSDEELAELLQRRL